MVFVSIIYFAFVSHSFNPEQGPRRKDEIGRCNYRRLLLFLTKQRYLMFIHENPNPTSRPARITIPLNDLNFYPGGKWATFVLLCFKQHYSVCGDHLMSALLDQVERFSQYSIYSILWKYCI